MVAADRGQVSGSARSLPERRVARAPLGAAAVSEAGEITCLRVLALDQDGRPCQLPSDEPHACGQDCAETQKENPEQRQEGDGQNGGNSIEEDRQGSALLFSKGPRTEDGCQRVRSNDFHVTLVMPRCPHAIPAARSDV